MTFGGHIIYFWPRVVVKILLQGPKINNMPSKSHVINIIQYNIQGQIIINI